MTILLKNCKVFDPNSKFHLRTINIVVRDGVIQISKTDIKSDQVFDLKGAWVSPGWIDLNSNFCDPGFEHKEDVLSGIKTAIAGGFTGISLLPNTHPVTETKGDVEYLLRQSGRSVDLYPIGALSEGTKGENMTELLDLNKAGAVAFSDGSSPVWNTELLLKALQYLQHVNGVIFLRPKDATLSKNTHVHEGKVSTLIGLRGEPALSEVLSIKQALEILRYAGGRLHFSLISSAEGLQLIRHAKKEGLVVTCDVGVHHLVFTDASVEGFDTRFKVDPPYRTDADRKALIKGVNDGVVDAIVSHHQPQDRESKYLEFDLAEFGAIGLQTVFAALQKVKGLDMEKAFVALTNGPRSILDLPSLIIEEGAKAELSVFDPDVEWVLDDDTNASKSRNSPFWKKPLKGRGIGIINNGTINLAR